MENVGIDGVAYYDGMMGSLKQKYQKAYSLFPFHYKKDQTSQLVSRLVKL